MALNTDQLVVAALTEAGLDDPGTIDGYGSDTWRPGLEALIDSANRDARLNVIGEATITDQVTKALRSRARVLDWHRRHPGEGAAIDQPVFIVGLPRTGTTLLSYLFDADPTNRSLLRWEAFDPIPPPSPAEHRCGPRVDAAQREMDALYELSPEFKGIHYEAADGPTECVTVLAGDFRSIHFETLATLPGYHEWLSDCDYRPAYAYHRRFHEALAADSPGRWVLKSPCHLLALDALLETYPDAVLVATHRDPTRVVASLVHLVTVLSGLGTDHDVGPYLATHWVEAAAEMMDNELAVRDAHGEDRWIDVPYAELVADPLATVAAIYDRLGWRFDEHAEAAIASYAAANPKGRHGAHRYDPTESGLDLAGLAERFAPYRDRFAIPTEPL